MLNVAEKKTPAKTLKLSSKMRTVALDHAVGAPMKDNAPMIDLAPREHNLTLRKGLPAPPRASFGPRVSKYPWNDMQPGDSFFIPGGKITTFYTLTSDARKKHGKNFRAYKLVEDGVEGVGVWCLAEAEGGE